MTFDYELVEMIAAELCRRAGGNWSRKRTKRNVWRRRAMALMAQVEGGAR
jgi:hypothetical protein